MVAGTVKFSVRARTLAVLLRRLWLGGEPYQPFDGMEEYFVTARSETKLGSLFSNKRCRFPGDQKRRPTVS